MTTVMRFWLFAAVVSQIILLPAYGQPVWQQVPVRTKAQKTAGVGGGEGMQSIRYMAYAPSSHNIAFMVNDMGYIWKSTDGGASWQKKNKGFLPISVRYVAVDPSDPQRVFVVSGMHSWEDVTAIGIHRSTDGGENWKLVKQSDFKGAFGTMRHGNLLAFSGSTIYAATAKEGILKSTDSGNSWAPYSLSGHSVPNIQIDPADPTILYASSQTNNLLYKIANNGASVSKIGIGLPKYPNHFVINPKNRLIMYAVAYDKGVYKSTNGGENFSSLNSNFTPAANFSGYPALHIAISPADPSYLYVSLYHYDYSEKSATFYYTNDGGAHWYEPLSMDEKNPAGWVNGSGHGIWNNAGRENWHISPTAPHPTDRNIALAVGGFNHYVERTTDGGANWRYSNAGYTGGHVGYQPMQAYTTPFVWDKNNSLRFMMLENDYGGWLTMDGGSSFSYNGARHDTTPDIRSCAGAFDPSIGSQTIVVGIGPNPGGGRDVNGDGKIDTLDKQDGQIIAVSNDNGTTWTTNPDTKRTGTWSAGIFQFIAFNSQDPNIVYADNLKSTNKGNTWTPIVRRIAAMYPGNGNIVYSFQGQTIFKSIDAGKTWPSSYPAVVSNDIRGIAIHPNNPDKIFVAAGDKGLYIINGSVVTLKNAANGLVNIGARAVAVDPKNPDVVYVSINRASINAPQSVFRSIDGGNTFADVSGNLSPLNVDTISVDPHTRYVYAASSAGTWKLPPPGTSDSIPPAAPTGLKVMQ
ncbi:MAG: hypothetical protein IT291_11270 [Deltaproteobacteria bacterium]|nr:hypothetical protein [Deltaproteobacteria bacterium]